MSGSYCVTYLLLTLISQRQLPTIQGRAGGDVAPCDHHPSLENATAFQSSRYTYQIQRSKSVYQHIMGHAPPFFLVKLECVGNHTQNSANKEKRLTKNPVYVIPKTHRCYYSLKTKKTSKYSSWLYKVLLVSKFIHAACRSQWRIRKAPREAGVRRTPPIWVISWSKGRTCVNFVHTYPCQNLECRRNDLTRTLS